MGGLWAKPKIIFHYRSDFEAEVHSKISESHAEQFRKDSQLQRACFHAYMTGQTSAAHARLNGCLCTQYCKDPPPFLHVLEDYIKNTSNHAALFQYLGLDMMFTTDQIHLGR